jgi:phage terminase small subunit
MKAPWCLYRLRVRYRMWRNSGPMLNRHSEAVNQLRKAAKRFGLSPGKCSELADLLEDRSGMR